MSSTCVICADPITLEDWRAPWNGEWAHGECVQNERAMLERLDRQSSGELTFDLGADE